MQKPDPTIQPLIPPTVQAPNRFKQAAEIIACIIVALPTSVLNGLAGVSGNASKAGSLNAPSDLSKLLSEADSAQLAFMALSHLLLPKVCFSFSINATYLALLKLHWI